MTAESSLAPLSARITAGEPYDFGTHFNDFLVEREQSRVTEVFLVRVVGRGCVPPHVHHDMEQTFVFTSGVATVRLWRGGEQRELECRPGELAFVPAGWWHTTGSESVEGLAYLTVNAFLAEANREGENENTVEHADAARARFTSWPGALEQLSSPDRVALHRATESAYANGPNRGPAENYEAFDVTLLRDPNTYRVRRAGPFEYVMDVEPRPRVITLEIADALAAASSGRLPVYVEGSQSPLSLKEPYSGSDVDLLVGVDAPDQLPAARAIVEKLAAMQDLVEVPLSPGIIHRPWLSLPGLYSAVNLAADSPDRWWWHAPPEARFAEARTRITNGLELVADQDAVTTMRRQALDFLPDPVPPERLRECRLVPRWLGLDVFPG